MSPVTFGTQRGTPGVLSFLTECDFSRSVMAERSLRKSNAHAQTAPHVASSQGESGMTLRGGRTLSAAPLLAPSIMRKTIASDSRAPKSSDFEGRLSEEAASVLSDDGEVFEEASEIFDDDNAVDRFWNTSDEVQLRVEGRSTSSKSSALKQRSGEQRPHVPDYDSDDAQLRAEGRSTASRSSALKQRSHEQRPHVPDDDFDEVDLRAVKRPVALPRRDKWIKPDKFSTSIPIESYISHFETVAHYNEWTAYDKVAHLKASLTGDAAQLLWDMGDHTDMSYKELVAKLRARFGSSDHRERFACQLRTLTRRSGQSLQELYNEVRRLMALSYPGPRTLN